MRVCKFNERDLSKKDKLRILTVFPSIFLIIGLLLTIIQLESHVSLVMGFKKILISPAILITDFYL